MGQVPHGSARTTTAIRRAIQHRQESRQSLAIRYRINPKTVAKWRKRPDVLTDNEVQFTPQTYHFLLGGHGSDRICREHGVAHRLTKPAHPWTNGQVERMHRTLKKSHRPVLLLPDHRRAQSAPTSFSTSPQPRQATQNLTRFDTQ